MVVRGGLDLSGLANRGSQGCYILSKFKQKQIFGSENGNFPDFDVGRIKPMFTFLLLTLVGLNPFLPFFNLPARGNSFDF